MPEQIKNMSNRWNVYTTAAIAHFGVGVSCMSIKRPISGGLKPNRMLGNILPSAICLAKLKIEN
jgi:hypothetical protein